MLSKTMNWNRLNNYGDNRRKYRSSFLAQFYEIRLLQLQMRQGFHSVFEETCLLSFTRTDLIGDRSWTIRRTIVANVRAYFRAKYLQYTRGRFFRFTSIVREKYTKYTVNDAVEGGWGESTRVVETAKSRCLVSIEGWGGNEGTESSNVQRLYTETSGYWKALPILCLGVKSKIAIGVSNFVVLLLSSSSSLLSPFLLKGS